MNILLLLYYSICVIIITSIIIIITIIRAFCASRVNIIHFMVYLILYKKPSTLSFFTTVFNFSTYGLDPWREYRTDISVVHILVYTEYVFGDDCLPVCLVLRSVNNNIMTLVPAMRCVKRQIVNTFFTLMSVDTRRNAGVEKKFNSCVGSVNVCSVRPIRIVYFLVIHVIVKLS